MLEYNEQTENLMEIAMMLEQLKGESEYLWPGNYLEVIEGFAREKILEFAGVEEKE